MRGFHKLHATGHFPLFPIPRTRPALPAEIRGPCRKKNRDWVNATWPASSSKLRLLSFEAGSSAAAKPWISTRRGPRLAVAALPWPGTRTASTGHLRLPGRGGTRRRDPEPMPGGKPRFRLGLRPSEAAGCRFLPSSAAYRPSTIRSARVRAYLFPVVSGRTPGSAPTPNHGPRTAHGPSASHAIQASDRLLRRIVQADTPVRPYHAPPTTHHAPPR